MVPSRADLRLLVVGPTGALGRDVVATAVARHHAVAALVRDPSRAHLPVDVELTTGDVLDRASLDAAVQGGDAVICALGTPSPRQPTTLLRDGTANLVAAMAGAGVERVRKSRLDWTIVRPPRFVKRRRRPLRVIRDGERGRVGAVNPADLARFLVDSAASPEHLLEAVVVGS